MVRWAWVMIALTPVGWATGIALVFLGGEGHATGARPTLTGMLGIIVFLAVPAVAVALAAEAGRGRRSPNRAAITVSGILFAVTIFSTLLVGTAAIIGGLFTLILVIFVGSRARKDRQLRVPTAWR